MTPFGSDTNFLLLNSLGETVTWRLDHRWEEFSENLKKGVRPADWAWVQPKEWISFWKTAETSENSGSSQELQCRTKEGNPLSVSLEIFRVENGHKLLILSQNGLTEESKTPSIFLEDAELRAMIFQRSANAIFLLDPETGAIIENNQTALQSFGTESASDFRGTFFTSLLVDGFSLLDYQSMRNRASEGESYTWEVEFKTFDQRTFWGSASFRTLTSSLHKIILVQIKDITEKINARKSLIEQSVKIAEHEANLNAVIENSEAMIWSINKNYEILIFNSSFKREIQKYYHFEIVPGFKILELASIPEEIQKWKEYYDRAFSGERFQITRTRSFEETTTFLETSFYPIKNSLGDIAGVSAVSVDITEKKLAEEKFKLLFEHSSEPHVLYDESGIFECNPATLNILRCEDKNLILGKHPSYFSTDKQPDETETIARRRGAYTFERNYRRFNGEEFPTEITLTPMKIHQKPAFLAVWHEITERKVYEDSLKRAKETAEAASKAKSDFLAMMSHEIRTPLNGVIGTVSLLEDTSLNLEQKEYLDIIKSSGQNLLILLNDILDLSRIESGQLKLEMQPVSPQKLSEEVCNLFRPMAEEKGLIVESKISSLVPNWIISDPYRLRQILMNLLGNSIKFTEKGRIILFVEAEKFPNEKLRIIFRLQDTGIGIPEEKLELLFKAFSQVDSSTTRRYGGSGLGLTISKKLAELMKGEIIVKSQLGRGSEFTLSIISEKLDYKIPVGVLELHSKNLAKIAIVSIQDYALKEQIKKFCERNGFSVKLARTAKEVIRIISEEERIGIFLTDLNLPDMNLPEILDELKNQTPNIKLTIILFMETELQNSYHHVTQGLFNRPGFKIFMMFKPILLDELSKIFEKAFPTRISKEEQTSGDKEKKLSERIPLKILLVEDNVINQKIAIRLLSKLGYSVDTANNGVEALSSLKSQSYQLIFMDIQMPEMDGFETTQNIRKNFTNPNPIIVAMTANAMEGDKEKCIDAGMDAYIAKPIQIQDLESTIAHLFQS
ncbi:hybrid sensor histidine kinase/response regulator [Leptospira tipperaryensis]|uniref:Sensory/regulatory protein RpfC n=1 Tax=Leptospira tipperaryensis TaxID=2564040 RepID=A0A1D7UXS5_9LEPT|nr:response regulator [Leptospira tipperaryensis]AOP34389.1 hybrid sensor histidine kinase/response regulator [Leptospira tipperaryensis]